MPINRKRIRLKVDLSQEQTLVDVRNNTSANLWRGNDCQYELGIFADADNIEDVSNLAAITVEAKLNTVAGLQGAPAMTKTITSADIKTDLNKAGWDDGAEADAHALLAFTNTETNIAISEKSEEYALIISCVTKDVPTREITLAKGILEFREDGHTTSGTPPVNDPNFLTIGESNAVYVLRSENEGEYLFDGTQLKLWNPDRQVYVAIGIVGAAGAQSIVVLED